MNVFNTPPIGTLYRQKSDEKNNPDSNTIRKPTSETYSTDNYLHKSIVKIETKSFMQDDNFIKTYENIKKNHFHAHLDTQAREQILEQVPEETLETVQRLIAYISTAYKKRPNIGLTHENIAYIFKELISKKIHPTNGLTEYLKLYPNHEYIYNLYERTGFRDLELLLNEIEKINNEKKLAQSTLNKSKITKGFPADELYRLFIDKKHWQLDAGLYTYEKELGYAKALLMAFSKLEDILSDEPLDYEKIKKLYTLATDSVFNLQLEDMNVLSFNEKNFFCLKNNLTTHSPFTKDGIKEVIALAKKMDSLEVKIQYTKFNSQYLAIPGELDFDGLDDLIEKDKDKTKGVTSILMFYHHLENGKAINEVKEYCNNFNEQLAKTKEDKSLSSEGKNEKIIWAIAEACRNIQITHPFVDGNARTIGCLLVNGLLMREGLSPAIIPDANMFDCYDIASLVEVIQQGQIEFQNIRQQALAKEKINQEPGNVAE